MGYKEYYEQLNVKKLEKWDKTGIQLKTFLLPLNVYYVWQSAKTMHN